MKFLKSNWKWLLVYTILFVLVVITSVALITKCVKDQKGNGTIVIDSQTFIEMIETDEDFVITIGQYECGACRSFNETLIEYTKDHKVYYLYLDNDNDLMLYDAFEIIINGLSSLPKDRGINLVMTPTTIYIEDGEFKDAYEGFVSKDDENYSFFVDIMDGKYVGKEFPIK